MAERVTKNIYLTAETEFLITMFSLLFNQTYIETAAQ